MDQNNNFNYNGQQPPMNAPMGQQPPMGAPMGQQPPMGAPMGQQPPMGAPYGQPPMGAPYGQPPMGAPYGQPPMGQPPVIDPDFVHPEVQAKEDAAFGRGLASLIMAEFPIASFFAIGLGGAAQKLAAESKAMAAYYGVDTHGKGQAGRILGKIGKIFGIVMSVFWVLYIVIIAAAVGAVM